MNIRFTCKHFTELSTVELYQMMQLRQEVFIMEQTCLYLDADGKDLDAYHVNGYLEDKLVAHCRLIKPNVKYVDASIGRVANDISVRRTGVGRAMMEYAIKMLYEKMGKQSIRISAQTYLKAFYESFGFKQVSEEYLEDHLPHIEMLKE